MIILSEPMNSQPCLSVCLSALVWCLVFGVVEVIKRKVPGLHQVTETGTLRNVEYYEPLEEGLKPVVNEKSISFLQITLSKDENLVNVKHVGYQYQTPHNTPGPGPVPVSQTTLLH